MTRSYRWSLRKRPRNSRPLAAHRRRLAMENLEGRRMLAASATFMNDNWHLVDDVAPPGPSFGDTVSNLNDAATPQFGAAGAITAIYGSTAFGVVTTPLALAGFDALYDEIDEAIAATAAGGTLNILAGQYHPASTIAIDKALTLLGPQAGIDPRTNRSAGSTNEAVISGGGSLGTIVRIKADNVRLDGLEIANSAPGMADMIESPLGPTIADPTIQYSFIHSAAGDEAIQLRSTSGALIQYNRVYHTNGDAINLVNATNGTIRNNQVFNVASLDAAIYVYGSTGTTISGNHVYDSYNNDGIKLGSSTGADASLYGGLIENNVVHDIGNGGDGITVYMSGVTVRGNEVYNVPSWHGAIFVQFLVNDLVIENNHVHHNSDPPPDGDQTETAGIKIGRSNDFVQFVTVRNNRIVNNDWGILVTGGTQGASTALIEGNDLSGNTIGVRIERGALVDLGSIADTGDGNSNPTGRSTGSDGDGSSRGWNVLLGYSGNVGNYAIENLNQAAEGDPIVKAENNIFGTDNPATTESLVYHQVDDPLLTAVDFLPPAPVKRIIDDGDSGFAVESGSWGTGILGYQENTRFAIGTGGTQVASWTFPVTPGYYVVSATWGAAANRATNAPYTIFDGVTPLTTVRVNQKVAPDDFSDAGAKWEILEVVEITGQQLVVRLSDDANEYVMADAVQVAPWTGPPRRSQQIDDGDPGFAVESGSWGFGGLGYQGDTRWAIGTGGAQVASWTFAVTPGYYRISATWGASANRATNSPYTIFDGATAVSTLRVNQKLAPADFSIAGTNWKVLGIVPITGSQLTVRLSDDANEYVMADAVRIETWIVPMSAWQLVDDGDPGFAIESGNWGNGTLGYQGDTRWAIGTGGTQVAAWTFFVTPGRYLVSATWGASANRATDAPYTIYDGSTALTTVRVNQKVAPNDFEADGTSWELLAAVDITGSPLIVRLSDDANEYVMADAIRIERIGYL